MTTTHASAQSATLSDRETLEQRFNQGECFKFLYFWGHRASPDSSITQSCFSHWFPAPFVLEDHRYPTAEHFMMAS
jgi:predicted NAD-dependent protein-ADP-ribosyltransferase YbiA (DUF1768 family)